jgi:hypothetical protein
MEVKAYSTLQSLPDNFPFIAVNGYILNSFFIICASKPEKTERGRNQTRMGITILLV